MGFDELHAAVESEEIQLKIVRDTGMYAVALLAVYDTAEGERLELAGSATLVEVAEASYILTARHVWEERIRSAERLGLTLTEAIDHSFLIDVRTIVPSGPPSPNIWGEWGPDIVLLRIPPEHVGGIRARRVFYSPTAQHADAPRCDHLETCLLLGTPAELGRFTVRRAELQITGFYTDPQTAFYDHDQFDYIDLAVTEPGTLASFGGVSGGGLWRVRIFESPETGNIDSIPRLEGVAFYQSPVQNGRRFIRCHGPASIRATVAGVQR